MFIELDGNLINAQHIVQIFIKDGKVNLEFSDKIIGFTEESIEDIKTKLKAAKLFTGLGVFRLTHEKHSESTNDC